VQDEVNQDYSEQNEVDGMKKGADCPLIIRDDGTCYGFINPRVGSIDV